MPSASRSSTGERWLASALADRDQSVADTAAWLAGHQHLDRLREPLLERLRTVPERAGVTAWALGHFGGPAVAAAVDDALRRELAGPRESPARLAQLAWATARLGDPRGTLRAAVAPPDRPAWLPAFAKPGATWREGPDGEATTFIVHSSVPFVRTGIRLGSGEGVEIETDIVRTPDPTGNVSSSPMQLAGIWGRRLQVAYHPAELVLTAWRRDDDAAPMLPPPEPLALVRFTIRR